MWLPKARCSGNVGGGLALCEEIRYGTDGGRNPDDFLEIKTTPRSNDRVPEGRGRLPVQYGCAGKIAKIHVTGWNPPELGHRGQAGNIFSGNINWENFLNYTLLSIPKEEYIPTVESLCGEYLEKWGTE